MVKTLMTTIGIISDTHIKIGGKRQLPPQVYQAFNNVDLILHAGDLNTLQVISDLEALAPVVAVHGNNDDWDAMQKLETARRIEIEGCIIGLTHGDQTANGMAIWPLGDVPGNNHTAAMALSHFPDADCVVFGHSHWPLIDWRDLSGAQGELRHVLLFNPGSATKKRRAPEHSCGILRVDGKRLEAELIAW